MDYLHNPFYTIPGIFTVLTYYNGIKFSLFILTVLIICSWYPFKKYFYFRQKRKDYILGHIGYVLNNSDRTIKEKRFTNWLGGFIYRDYTPVKKKSKKRKSKK